MIINKLEKKENFTNNEKEIADYILRHLEEIHLLSAENLAKKAFVSKALLGSAGNLGLRGIGNFRGVWIRKLGK